MDEQIYKMWINVDSEGTITNVYGGHKDYAYPPEDPFDFMFDVDDYAFKNVDQYKVENGELVKIAPAE